jgi:hypothetical protein
MANSGEVSGNAQKQNGERDFTLIPLTEAIALMPTYQTFTLSEPSDSDKISASVLAYFQERNRNRIHEIVLTEFIKSGITQTSLASRLGQKPARVSKLLGAPGNWTLDTVSDLLFSISGAEASYSISYPIQNPVRNYSSPDWVITHSGNTATVNASSSSSAASVNVFVYADRQQTPTLSSP